MKYINMTLFVLCLISLSSKAYPCDPDFSVRPSGIGVEYDVRWYQDNISGPDVTIAGPENIAAQNGESFQLSLSGSDPDNDDLFYFWRREGNCEFSVDPCDTNSEYTTARITVYGGEDTDCMVFAYANDGRGRQDIARVSFKQDSDGDGVPNPDDAFPDDPTEWHDSDNDGIGDNQDTDSTICHIPPGNPDNAHTINISENALPAHFGHGDTLGPCEGDLNINENINGGCSLIR